MKRAVMGSLVSAVLVAGLSASALAQPKNDVFNGIIQRDGSVTGGGSGWNGGQWVEYPNTGWWNQWFYDDPPDRTRWKKISYDIHLFKEVPVPNNPVDVEVAINWSTMAYPATGPNGDPPIPPLTPLEEQDFIGRDIIFSGPVLGSGPNEVHLQDDNYVIPDFNPEWISIDVRLLTPNPDVQVHFDGTIEHECLPEPATLSLLALGGLVALRRRRR